MISDVCCNLPTLLKAILVSSGSAILTKIFWFVHWNRWFSKVKCDVDSWINFHSWGDVKYIHISGGKIDGVNANWVAAKASGSIVPEHHRSVLILFHLCIFNLKSVKGDSDLLPLYWESGSGSSGHRGSIFQVCVFQVFSKCLPSLEGQISVIIIGLIFRSTPYCNCKYQPLPFSSTFKMFCVSQIHHLCLKAL